MEEALRLLHHLELPIREVEKTGGRYAECWFYRAPHREESEESEQSGVDTSHTSQSPTSEKSEPAESGTEAGKPETETVSGDMKL